MCVFSEGFDTLGLLGFKQSSSFSTKGKGFKSFSSSSCSLASNRLHISRCGGTSDNFDQLSSNDSLSGSVVQNLVLANHLTSILGGVLRREVC